MNWSRILDYCDVFISYLILSLWRHPFTAVDPLVSKSAKFLQICSDEETLLQLEWPIFSFLGKLFLQPVFYNFLNIYKITGAFIFA